MQTGSRILTPEQCEKIIAHIDECLALFDHKAGLLNAAEIRAKSLLAVLRSEIVRQLQSEGTLGPFE